MDISGMMAPDRIVALGSQVKEEALVELARILATGTTVKDAEDLVKAILDREEIMSTGIGQEFAVPHAKLTDIRHFSIAVGTCKDGMEYGSLDKLPVRVITMIAAPEGEQNTYLKVLKKVTEVLKIKANRNRIVDLIESGNTTAVIDLFRE
ncbi:MAG: PTS sugar transporter subunit IIA [Planctomycetota bacterium]